MDENQAKNLVIKLTNAAYEAGMHHHSTMKKHWQEKAEELGEEIVGHLSTNSSKKLLTLIELNLTKLGRQYKSGQAVLISDALEALTEVRHLTKPIESTTDMEER